MVISVLPVSPTLPSRSLSVHLPPSVGTVTFIGSHFDVVPANPQMWERNPFKLKREVLIGHYAHTHLSPSPSPITFHTITSVAYDSRSHHLYMYMPAGLPR